MENLSQVIFKELNVYERRRENLFKLLVVVDDMTNVLEAFHNLPTESDRLRVKSDIRRLCQGGTGPKFRESLVGYPKLKEYKAANQHRFFYFRSGGKNIIFYHHAQKNGKLSDTKLKSIDETRKLYEDEFKRQNP